METLLDKTRGDILTLSVLAVLATPLMVVVLFYLGLAYL